MKRPSLAGLVIALLITACTGASTAHAQDFSVSRPIELENFPRFATTQHASQWCWAATIASVFSFYGVRRSQEEIVAATYGALVNLPAQTPYQLYGVLNHMSFDSSGDLEIATGDFGWGAPVASDLVDELERGHPVIAWYVHGSGGHAVVIIGVRVTDSYAGPVVESIKFWDPWPGNGVQVVPAIQLASRMASYFSIRAVRVSGGDSGKRLARRTDSCEYANDGTCDEPDLCESGTDATDCGLGGRRERRERPERIDMPRGASTCCTLAGACPLVVEMTPGAICTCVSFAGSAVGRACN